jgi:hypothetical protein
MICLMCNHALHKDQPNHVLTTHYRFETGTASLISMIFLSVRANYILLVHTCRPLSRRAFDEVELPYAIDLQLPGWQKWLKESKTKLRNALHEEMREKAAVRNPLWSYELTVDDCNGSC